MKHPRVERVADVPRPRERSRSRGRGADEDDEPSNPTHDQRVDALTQQFETGERRVREAIRLIERGTSHKIAARDVGWDLPRLQRVAADFGLHLPDERPRPPRIDKRLRGTG